MSHEGLRYTIFSRRALLLAGLKGLAVVTLGGRLYYLSIVKGEQYRLRAEENRIDLRLIAPERGEILDRNGEKLAKNKQDYQVYLIPEQADDIVETLNRLGRIITISDQNIARIKKRMKRQRKFSSVTIAENLSWEAFSKINVSAPDLPGVVLDAGRTRTYPDGPAVAQIVGYVGVPRESDGNDPLFRLPGFKIGIQGIESSFDKELRGYQGTQRFEVNSVGREIRELQPRQDATQGKDIKLSIDLALQRYSMERLGESAAGAVVLDIRSGEILAMASAPSFDPNDFNLGLSIENWQALLKDPRKPLLNKSITGQFPPGSTIKMVVALAALEKGIITSKTKYHCNGKHPYGDRVFHCWEKRGHGNMDLLSALQHSCDVYFYNLAEKLEIDDLAKMAEKFGLGSLFDIGLDNQKRGLVPTREWKQSVMGEKWHGGETLNVSIGQGAMLATPLQLAVMAARLASGRMVEPSLVKSIGEDEPLSQTAFETTGVNPLHLKLVQTGMQKVMAAGGTGFDYRRSKSKTPLAGKTGTAQVRRISEAERKSGVIKNEELAWRSRDHALFVGYGPVENPRYAVCVLVQHGGGGSTIATPIGRDLLDKMFEIEAAFKQSDGEGNP